MKTSAVSKHTPGPWMTAGQKTKPHNYALIGIGNGAVHVGYASLTPAVHPLEAEANLRLIVAAPDLLTIARKVMRDLKVFQSEDVEYLTVERVADMIHGLERAIAKATGDSQP